MPTDPAKFINARIPQIPHDGNQKWISPMMFPVADSNGDIIGYAPPAVTVLPDGTAQLQVDTEFTLNGNVVIDNIRVASNDGINPNQLIKTDDDGSVMTHPSGEVSTVNSSTALLGSGAIFTGTFEDTLKFAHITVQVRTDQVSAVDGLVIEWSSDGVNVDDTDKFTIPANNGKIFTFGPQAQFFRVKYTNDAFAQGVFRLHTVLRSGTQKASTVRLSDEIVSDDDAELVKAILAGLSTGNIFKNFKITDEGALLVSIVPGEIPPDTVEVTRNAQSSLTTSADDLFTITNGKSLTIQVFLAGAQTAIGGSKVELFEDPNGDLSVLNIINPLYVDGSSSSILIGKTFAGDGTRRILMRRTPTGGGPREIFGEWRGFEE